MSTGIRDFAHALVFMLVAAAPTYTAAETWEGRVSDSMCARKHESGAEGQETTDADCTRDCVKGGSKYVLIVGEKVFAVANQDHPGLAAHAGQAVRVTGSLSGDAITIATVAAR